MSSELAVTTLGGGSPKTTIVVSADAGARSSSGSTPDADFAGDESLLDESVGVLATRGLFAALGDEAAAVSPTGVNGDNALARMTSASAGIDEVGGEAATAMLSTTFVITAEGLACVGWKPPGMGEGVIGQLVPGGGDAFPHEKELATGGCIVPSPSCMPMGVPTVVHVGAVKRSVHVRELVNRDAHDRRCLAENHPIQASGVPPTSPGAGRGNRRRKVHQDGTRSVSCQLCLGVSVAPSNWCS